MPVATDIRGKLAAYCTVCTSSWSSSLASTTKEAWIRDSCPPMQDCKTAVLYWTKQEKLWEEVLITARTINAHLVHFMWGKTNCTGTWVVMHKGITLLSRGFGTLTAHPHRYLSPFLLHVKAASSCLWDALDKAYPEAQTGLLSTTSTNGKCLTINLFNTLWISIDLHTFFLS